MNELLYIGTFVAGIILGGWVRDKAWMGKATSGTRMLRGKQFYFIVKEDDIVQAEAVLDWCKSEA